MKYIYFVLLFSVFGCKDAIKNEDKLMAYNIPDKIEFVEPVVNNSLIVNSKEDLLGYWVGDFEADFDNIEIDSSYNQDEDVDKILYNKITLSIDEINGNTIKGHSIVSGNISPFEGKIEEGNSDFIFELIENENKKTDGTFFCFIRVNDSIITGKWAANNPEEVRIDMKKYKLKKKLFNYDKNIKLTNIFLNSDKSNKIIYRDTIDGEVEEYEEKEYFATTGKLFKTNASNELLTKDFVSNLTKGDIYILRNSIFARHGYAFRDKQLRMYFENYDWYMPVFGDVKDDLSEIEKKNVDLLLRYEQNAKEYYDTFGR